MKNVNPLVLGVLGGMGSYSTLHFFEQVLAAFDVEKEWERPRVIIDNNCVLPSRVRAILYEERREQLTQGMADSIRRLLTYEPHAIAIPCNTAHCFLDEVRAENRTHGITDDRIVDMLQCVADANATAGREEVFLMATEGTVATRVYEDYHEPLGVRIRNPSEAQLVTIREFIEQVKQRKPLDVEGFRRFVAEVDAGSVILGCTELSSFHSEDSPVTLVDPMRLVVTRVVEMAQELQNLPAAATA